MINRNHLKSWNLQNLHDQYKFQGFVIRKTSISFLKEIREFPLCRLIYDETFTRFDKYVFINKFQKVIVLSYCFDETIIMVSKLKMNFERLFLFLNYFCSPIFFLNLYFFISQTLFYIVIWNIMVFNINHRL